jgi:hypothetical protein
MALTIRILLTSLGADAGPSFNIYSNNDNYTTAFDSATRAQLLAGYTSTTVPDNTTRIKLVSTGVCGTTIYISITNVPSVTPTVTPTPTKTPSLTPSNTPSLTPSRSAPKNPNWPTPTPFKPTYNYTCCGELQEFTPGFSLPPVFTVGCGYYNVINCSDINLLPCNEC